MFGETATDGITQFEDAAIGDRVVHEHALLPTLDQPTAPEELQVFGDIGLRGPRGRHQIRHRQFTLLERLEQTQAQGIAEQPEPPGDEL